MEYRIVLTRMEFHALHGCYELERKVGTGPADLLAIEAIISA